MSANFVFSSILLTLWAKFKDMSHNNVSRSRLFKYFADTLSKIQGHDAQ